MLLLRNTYLLQILAQFQSSTFACRSAFRDRTHSSVQVCFVSRSLLQSKEKGTTTKIKDKYYRDKNQNKEGKKEKLFAP